MTTGKRIEVYRGGDGWRWRAITRNGEIIATGESHSRKWNAKRAARRAFPDWPVVKVDR